MKKFLAIAVLCAPALASADNVGECGWGSKLMEGNKGIAPQVLAVTTNGTFGNQTFGITSGTSGCTQDGVVKSSWKMAAFVDENKTKLARDIASGEGATLSTLADLMNVDSADRAAFYSLAKDNFATIFPREDVASAEILSSLKGVLAGSSLSKYSTVI